MISSMTGYGKAEQILGGRNIIIEIKSVNSRYFEYSSRMPRAYNFLEDKIKKLLNEEIKRGKTELNLSIQDIDSKDTQIEINKQLVINYNDALNEIASIIGKTNNVNAEALSRFQDVLIISKKQEDEDTLWTDIRQVANIALNNFCQMRLQEGNKLKEDILSRIVNIENMVEQIKANSEERVQKYKDKLYTRLLEVLQSTNIDESRILTEAAIFADKTAVDEETVRLHSHFEQFRQILNEGGAVGRKLDFLTQELNRETNTIGSKCSEISITRIVIEIKAEIEKIREQVQNIE